jgi:DNA replication protein DnaC
MEGKFVFLTHKSPLPCAETPTKIFSIFCKRLSLMLVVVRCKGDFVTFSHLHSLLERLAQGRADNSHRRIIQQILAPDLLILDEIGFRALNPQALDDFFEIIRHRYEHKSTIFTSNRNFEDWGAILGDKVMASAIIDRIVHHAHILKFSGESYRIKDFLTQLNNIA